MPSDMKVSELIDDVTGQWNVELIREVFYEEDCRVILSIPLASSINIDRYIWHYNRKGTFSVRSAYHLAVKINRDADGWVSNSINNQQVRDWRWLWALNLPSKILIFLWRACNNILPTCNNLKKRRVMEDNRCVFCDEQGEDIMHCFFYCSLARQIWALSDLPQTSYITTTTEVREWMLEIKKKGEPEVVEKCVVICWAIWHARNNKVFEGKVPNALEISDFSRNYWHNLRAVTAEVLRSINQRDKNLVRWNPPEQGVVKINFDAAINDVAGVCGLGAIARSNTGECLGWLSRCIKQPLDPVSAEAKAALIAVDLARENNWRRIILEGDCLEVITAIERNSSYRADHGNIIADIQRLGATFEMFKAQHILRGGNRVAHEVAALSKFEDCVLNVIPKRILDIVSTEMSA